MPREKLCAEGAKALTLPELLAIIFGTGARGESVLALANRLLKEYGSQGLRDLRNVDALAREMNLPPVKACQLIACFELGERLYKTYELNRPPLDIRSPMDVVARMPEMRTLQKEQLRGLYLNARHRVIHEETISVGTLTANLVHPVEVLRLALEYHAAGVIIVYNHPSGDPEPSDQDIAITSQLAQAASVLSIKLLDHIIVGAESHVSLRERGLL